MIVPMVLGLARLVEFKWVLLWESVMFFPVILLVALFYAPSTKGINTQKVKDMYIPKRPKGR